MSYLILARKYRPQSFADLTGQSTTAKILQSAIVSDKIAPAYLFSGPRGTGKTTSARIFAKALNCHKPKKSKNSAEPCNECPSCTEIAQGICIDVLEIDAASHTQVDNIREVVIDTVHFAPVRDRRKIFIIDEVHMLSTHSFNALLKTLEEPPAHVTFVLCTTEFHKIPKTIYSRCQRFRFLSLSETEIHTALKQIAAQEKIPVNDDALAILARAAGGSLRDALSLLDQSVTQFSSGKNADKGKNIDAASIEETLGVVNEQVLDGFVLAVSQKDPKSVLDIIGKVSQEGFDLSYFLKELRERFRQMLIHKCGYADPQKSAAGTKSAESELTIESLLRISQVLTKCAEQMRWNDMPRLVLESYAVWICRPAMNPEEIISRIERLSAGGAGFTAPQKIEQSSPRAPIRSAESAPVSVPSPIPQAKVQAPVPAETKPSAAVPPPASQSDSSSNNFLFGWHRVLGIVRETKPFLSRGLETAEARMNKNKVELIFPKDFWMSSVNRYMSDLLPLLRNQFGKDILVELKVGNPKPAAPVPAEDEIEAIDEESAPQPALEQAPDPSATDEQFFEVAEESLMPKDNTPIEDEGLKTFVKVFPGKLTRMQDSAP